MKVEVRDFVGADLAELTRLNNSELPHVSGITETEFQTLADQAFAFRVATSPDGELVGFVLALDQGAVYASLNFLWFQKRYSNFVYVDRIVVAKTAQGKGIGRLLYADLEVRATGRASPLLTCEVNVRPPNPTSFKFHEKFGFREVGQQDTEGGKKTVSLMAKSLSS